MRALRLETLGGKRKRRTNLVSVDFYVPRLVGLVKWTQQSTFNNILITDYLFPALGFLVMDFLGYLPEDIIHSNTSSLGQKHSPSLKIEY